MIPRQGHTDPARMGPDTCFALAGSDPSRRAFVERALMTAMASLFCGAGRGGAGPFEDVKKFHGRGLTNTTYEGILLRYFVESWTVDRRKLSTVIIRPGDEMKKFVEYMGEVGWPEPSSYVRCDTTLFNEGDKEKWIYRSLLGTWVAHRVFHPSRKEVVRLAPNEKLMDDPPNEEIIVEGTLPQFDRPEDYIKWMAISVCKAKEAEVPLGEHIPMVKHIVIEE